MALEDSGQIAWQKALAYISQHHVITLATSGPEGLWAAAVFYAYSDLTLYFLSAKTTRHAINLAANPWTAATIQDDYIDWPQIQGIQLEGTVSRLLDDQANLARKLFSDRYPFLETASPTLRAALSKVNWYRLEPMRLFFVDNTQGFGHREEVVF